MSVQEGEGEIKEGGEAGEVGEGEGRAEENSSCLVQTCKLYRSSRRCNL